MNVLIVGVSGFIGHHLYQVLQRQDFYVSGCSRTKVAGINWQYIDFNQTVMQWQNQLQGVDILINAAGIFSQSSTQRFLKIHDLGPKRLFEACREENVRVIQISAIGAELENPGTEFLQSKRNADQFILQSDLPNVVLYPGIVLGEKGRTTRQLSLLARLHCIPMVLGKNRELPLISIYQLSDYIVQLINHWPDKRQAKVLIAKPETLEQLFNQLRIWMGVGKGCFIYLPEMAFNSFFRLFPGLSVGTFNRTSIQMLNEYAKRSYIPSSRESASESLLREKASRNFLKEIRLKALFYLNLAVLGLIWILSGISSLVNIEQSRELISLLGIAGNAGDAIIAIAAVADIFLGLLLWIASFRRWVIYMQILVMLIYSLIILIYIPMLWLHPFAPVIKNLAMLVLALYLLIEEKE